MDNKQVALIRLINGDEAKEIASDLDVSYGTVIRWKNELTKAQMNDKVNQLLAIDQAVLEDMASTAMTDVPDSLLPSVQESAGELVTSVVGLQHLEANLQTTANAINAKIRSMTYAAESVGDITELTVAICALQSAFFGKGTQVNIQNNIGSSEYAEFLGDAPGV